MDPNLCEWLWWDLCSCQDWMALFDANVGSQPCFYVFLSRIVWLHWVKMRQNCHVSFIIFGLHGNLWLYWRKLFDFFPTGQYWNTLLTRFSFIWLQSNMLHFLHGSLANQLKMTHFLHQKCAKVQCSFIFPQFITILTIFCFNSVCNFIWVLPNTLWKRDKIKKF